MANWRRWLARKLDPETFDRADRGWYLGLLVGDLHRWCGEFREIDAATRWLLACQAAHFRKLGEPAPDGACSVSEFRERLRRSKPC